MLSSSHLINSSFNKMKRSIWSVINCFSNVAISFHSPFCKALVRFWVAFIVFLFLFFKVLLCKYRQDHSFFQVQLFALVLINLINMDQWAFAFLNSLSNKTNAQWLSILCVLWFQRKCNNCFWFTSMKIKVFSYK